MASTSDDQPPMPDGSRPPKVTRRTLPPGRALNEAVAAHRAGRLDEARTIYAAILRAHPGHFDALQLLGALSHQQGRHAEAALLIQRALEQRPDSHVALNNLGSALSSLGRKEQAVTSYRQALALRPGHAGTHFNLGIALADLQRHDEAVLSYRRALEIEPDHVGALYNLGNLLRDLHRHDEAIASYRRALEVKPGHVGAHLNLGNLMRDGRRHAEAAARYRRVLEIEPDHVGALLSLGNLMRDLHRYEDAAACYQRAIETGPDHAEAHFNLGVVLGELKRQDEEILSYRRALRIRPDHPLALSRLARALRHRCDWQAYDDLGRALSERSRSERHIESPFVLLSFSDDPEEQLRCARRYATCRVGTVPPLPRRKGGDHPRIRLAYISADFREHAMAYLMAELFELHDRSRFEVFGISLQSDGGSAMRRRLEGAFDRVVDARGISDREVASQIAALETDIAIDLMGYTRYARPAILAPRPAQVQVSYLGFPGTMGTDFIDYILVDPFVVPGDQQPWFTEKLVHLPDCYQVSDRKRPIAEAPPSREACGLPEHGVVFCCFNPAYKITPPVFDIWMRLLRAIPGSVLWLLAAGATAEGNLRREAEARGVEPGRLVFAPRLTLPDHLARHRLADLFLDTVPYNAHTTASDALWAGLPLLTCAGRTFAARVAGSLLHAVGLPELVTSSLGQYEALAQALAQGPERRHALRTKLAQNRDTAPLFDTDRFRRHVEDAYTEMWRIARSGEAPRPFGVASTRSGSPAQSNFR